MSYLEQGRVWADYLENVNKSINRLVIVNQTCEDTIKAMYKIDRMVYDAVIKNWGPRQLPYDQVFVMVFYKRNIAYLQSAYILASIGFVGPSANTTRTVFETLLREYLFIVDKEEANEYYRIIDTTQETPYNIKKGLKYMRDKLYSDSRNQTMKEMYSLLCSKSHPDIKGSNLDYPNYSLPQIEDIMRSILLQMYGNIEVFAEGFYDLLDSALKSFIKQSMSSIAFDTGYTLAFEPDIEPYASLIRLKNGNFDRVL